jgi:hypothetical protein
MEVESILSSDNNMCEVYIVRSSPEMKDSVYIVSSISCLCDKHRQPNFRTKSKLQLDESVLFIRSSLSKLVQADKSNSILLGECICLSKIPEHGNAAQFTYIIGLLKSIDQWEMPDAVPIISSTCLIISN